MEHPPKYPSTPHWPDSESVHRDDSYHTEPEIFVNRPVVITEKLDGGNTCLWNGEVYARSTTAPSRAGWMAMVRKHHAWKTADPTLNPFTFYGEDIYGVHSIEYDAVPEDETFRLFAVRQHGSEPDGSQDVILNWNTIVREAQKLGFPLVPVVFQGRFQSIQEITEFFRQELQKPSALGGPREGFVMRSVHGFFIPEFPTYICKYVRPNHVQTDEHWTRNWKPCRIKERQV